MSIFKNMKHLPLPLRWLVASVLRLWAWTLRVRFEDPRDEVNTPPATPRIYIIWHNRLPLLPVVVPRRRRKTLAFLASRSRDGGYIADVLGTLGMRAVRGSSSRGGATALRQLRGLLAEGISVCLTPDGPRGPRYEVQDGVLWLAAQTGCAIVPVALNSPRHYELRSWDRTQFPVLFSTIEFTLGEPLTVDADLEEATLPAWRQRVRKALLDICRYDHTGS